MKIIFGVISRKEYIIFILLSVLIASCDRIDFLSGTHVATVNGAKIYLDEYQLKLNQKMTLLPKDITADDHRYISRLEDEVLDQMITDKIMQLRAKELKISVEASELDDRISEIRKDYGEDFVNLLAQQNIRYEQWREEIKKELLIQKLVAVDVNSRIKVSDDEAEDYYNENRDKYRQGAQVRAAQIVVRDAEAAKEILARLNSGENFATLAARHSISPEASSGGDLGYLTRDEMPEPLDSVIFKLPLNKISSVVQSPYGFHVFKIMDIQQAKTKSFAEAKDEIIAEIRARKEEAAFANWLNSLKFSAVIKKENTVLRKKVNRQK